MIDLRKPLNVFVFLNNAGPSIFIKFQSPFKDELQCSCVFNAACCQIVLLQSRTKYCGQINYIK